MSRIDELIAEHCPNGVEHVPLREVCDDFIVPMRDRPKAFDGDIPWCRIEDIEGTSLNGSLSGLGVTEDVVRKMNLKVVPTGTVIAACSASLGNYAIATRPLITNQTFIGLVCGPRLYNRYLLHLMFTKTAALKMASTTGTIAYVSRKKFEGLTIPVPSLEVQHEIVRILDTFSKMEAELEAELEARKQQYEHYRRNLLAPTGKCPVLELHEIADFTNAKAHEKLVHPDGTVALMTARFISRGVANRYVMPEDVLTPAFTGDVALVMSDLPNGRALARTFFVDEDEKYAANQRVCLLRSKDSEHLSPRYLHYIMNRNKQLLAYDSGVDQTHLKKDYILKVRLEVPPVEEQRRVVDILDKFDALVNDLSVGIPAELAARRQQYEYYRDKLLTFKQLEPAS